MPVRAVIGLLVLLVPLSAPRAASTDLSVLETTRTERSQSERGVFALTDVERARLWGLRLEDWQRYRAIMQGPRGTWTPDIDPLTALGIHAESDTERQRYADLLLRLEIERVERELAFERTVQQIKAERYAHLAMFDPERLAEKLTEARQRVPVLTRGDRALLFVTLECTACDVLLERMLTRVQSTPGLALDVYVMGNAAETAIREWAARRAIPPALVESHRITLNHDTGTLLKLTRDPTVTAPVLLRSRGNALSALPHNL